MKLRTVAMTGVLALLGLGLVGVGAHAVFTTTTASSQQITGGTPTVITWASNAVNGCDNQADATTDGCGLVVLAPQTVGSTFDSPSTVYVMNTGNIPVTLDSMAVNDSDGSPAPVNANGALELEMGLCIQNVYGGLLVNYPGYDSSPPSQQPISPTALAVGQIVAYNVDLYAGETSSFGCGSLPALQEAASGGTDTVTITPGYTG
jgi:hypothetical protein